VHHRPILARKTASFLTQKPIAAIPALAALAVAACGSGGSVPQASIATTLAAGSAALRQGNYHAAEQLFWQVTQRDPKQVAGYYDLGVAYQNQGDDRDALIAYAEAQRLDEDFVPVIYNRAVLYSASDPQLAMFLYRRVISIQDDSATAYLNLGLLEAAHTPELRQQAEALLARAVRLDPSLASHIPSALRTGLRAASAGASAAPGGKRASSSPKG
jgi:tetratricopeptide (TPR) repeat protein